MDRQKRTIYVSVTHSGLIMKELQAQFREGRNCDLEIRLGKKRLYVHKCLVDSFFIKAGAELEDDRFFLDLSQYSQPIIEALVGMMYSGNLKCAPSEVGSICIAANRLGCEEGIRGCRSFFEDAGMEMPLEETADTGQHAGISEADSFQVSFPSAVESEPSIIIKTEPPEDLGSSEVMLPEVTSNLALPNYETGLDKPEGGLLYTTLCVPVTGPDAGKPVNLSRPKNSKSKMLSGTTQLVYTSLPTLPMVRPALNNRGKYSVSNTSNFGSREKHSSPMKTGSPGLKRGRPRKNVDQEDDNPSNLAGEVKKKRPYRKRKTSDVGSEVKEKKKSKKSSDEGLSGDILEDGLKEGPQKPVADQTSLSLGSLIQCKTKAGVVYFKAKNTKSLLKDKFPANVSDVNAEGSVKTLGGTASQSSVKIRTGEEIHGAQEIKVEMDTDEPGQSKTAEEAVRTGPGPETEGTEESQQREQMFFLGLAKTSDQVSNLGKKTMESSGKRRLRERKKVDYSKFDDGNDVDSYESDALSAEENVEGHYYGGKCVKISKATKHVFDKQFNSNDSSSDNSSLPDDDGVTGKRTKTSTSIPIKVPASKRFRSGGTVAVPVEHGVQADDSECDIAYFPPAGTVPKGVRSQYARGNILKLKTVTEEIYDKDGNVTVVTKKIPLRPRQFGLDERLMKRPSVYICHPTAPVVKPFINRRKTR